MSVIGDRPCSSCGRAVEAEAQFCRHCGVPIAHAHGLPPLASPVRPPSKSGAAGGGGEADPAPVSEGELKQVTVLFADVQGSLALSEQVDPEEWHGIISRFFSLLAGAARRYGGVVSRFTGDGIMALFGAPVAQEDHAQRACHAAIHAREVLSDYAAELRRVRGLSFSVRLGLNSGPVVAARIGEEGGGGITALGPTVNLAERMERLAEPGRIYVTEDTAGLVGGFFELADLGRFEMPGETRSIRVFEVVGRGLQRSRLDFARLRGLSRFVGREREMARLESILDQVLAGEGHTVEIVGAAGVGKSRLCAEFVSEARRRGLPVVEAHGFAHLAAMPYLTLIEDLRQQVQIEPQDSDEVAREKIAAKVLEVDPTLADRLPLVFGMLGVASSGSGPSPDHGSQAHVLGEIIERASVAASAKGPFIVLVEDAQWLDPASGSLLESLLWTTPSTRTLVLLTFRPGYRAPHPPTSRVEHVELSALGEQGSTELLHHLLGEHPSVAPLFSRIQERTQGNPFFTEEIVWSLADAGVLDGERGRFRLTKPVAGVPLPATLQATLGSRIDQLPAEHKRVLQLASVVGLEFDLGLLRRILAGEQPRLATAMTALARAGFVDRSDVEDQDRFRFSHPLMHEEVYFSQLGETRMRSHALVAQALAQIDASQIDARAGLLSHHWENAGEALQAARWMTRSARWVSSRRITEALRSWRRVAELVSGLPRIEAIELAVDAHIAMLECGARIGLSEEESARIFAEGESLARRMNDRLRLARLFGARCQVLAFAGDARGALELGRHALELVEAFGDRDVIRDRRAEVMFGLFAAGRFRELIALAEATLSPWPMDPRDGRLSDDPRDTWILCFHAMTAIDMGRIDEAKRELEMVIDSAQRIEALEVLCIAWGFSPIVAQISGEGVELAIARARRAVHLAEKLESPLSSYFARWGLGVAHLLGEEWDHAERMLRFSLEGARRSGVGLLGESGMLANLAEAVGSKGDVEGALALAREAIAVGRQRGTKLFECVSLLVFARFSLVKGDEPALAEAVEALDAGDALVEAEGLLSLKPMIHVLRAFTARGERAEQVGVEQLIAARDLFREMGAPASAEKIAALLPPGLAA
jgi:class 3 adenylate cyclase